MDPKEVYKAYKVETATAAETLKEAVSQATAAFANGCAAATNAYIAAMDVAVDNFRQAAK